VLSVIAAVAYGAGYMAILRKALTLGLPNPETSRSAYQHMGLSMLLDTLSAIGTGVASAHVAATLVAIALGLCVAISVGAKSPPWSALGMVVGYLVLAAVVVHDGLQIWRGFDASNLLQRAPEALDDLQGLAARLFEAVRSGSATAIRQDFAGFAVALLAVVCAAIVLEGVARHCRASLNWHGAVIAAQLVFATVVFGDLMLLAQLYGVVSLADSQRCVLVSYTQSSDVNHEKSQQGWLMSDLAFSGDRVHLLEPDSDSRLYVIKRADVVSYRLYGRANCKNSMLPNAHAQQGGTP